MSGKINLKAKKRLLSILNDLCLKRERVILASGTVSNYYFDARIGSLSSEGAYLIARIILNMIKNDKIDAVGGLTLGADPIIGSIVALSFKTKQRLNGFIVRKEEKKHGMGKLIEGCPLKKSSRVLIIDDVVTTGSSTIKAIKAVKATGAKIIRVIAIVDRLAGAKKNIKKYNLKFESIFTIEDFNL